MFFFGFFHLMELSRERKAPKGKFKIYQDDFNTNTKNVVININYSNLHINIDTFTNIIFA